MQRIFFVLGRKRLYFFIHDGLLEGTYGRGALCYPGLITSKNRALPSKILLGELYLALLQHHSVPLIAIHDSNHLYIDSPIEVRSIFMIEVSNDFTPIDTDIL